MKDLRKKSRNLVLLLKEQNKVSPHLVHFYHRCCAERDKYKSKIGFQQQQGYLHISCANAYTAIHLEEDLTFKVSDTMLLLYLQSTSLLNRYNVKLLQLANSLLCTTS